jgi:hypothetical protein
MLNLVTATKVIHLQESKLTQLSLLLEAGYSGTCFLATKCKKEKPIVPKYSKS